MKLFCPNGHVYRTRHFRRESDEVRCPACGAYLETGMQKRSRAKARSAGGQLRKLSAAESAAAARFHAIVCSDPCWGISHREGHRCSERLEAHHLITKSWIQVQLRSMPESVMLAVKYSPLLGVPLCDDLHRAITDGMEAIYFDEVGREAISYAREFDRVRPTGSMSFLARLEVECPARPQPI